MIENAGQTPYVRNRRGKSVQPAPTPAPAVASPTSSTSSTSSSTSSYTLPAILSYAPHPDLSALVLVLVRVLGAYFVTAQWDRDADETFNYWEPMHYMLYGSGMQTWEANVRYMFRSYGYGGLYALLGFLMGGFHGDDKLTVYHRVRMGLALGCAAAEAYLYTSVKVRFGARVALLMLLGMLLSSGMLQVSSSFLPNTFTMVGFTMAWGLWLRCHHAAAAAVAALALALGFPFAVLALPPLGLHILASTLPPALISRLTGGSQEAQGKQGWDWQPVLRVLGAAAGALAAATAYAACVDRWYYGVWSSYQANTLLYNLGLKSDGNGQGSNNFADPAVASRAWYVQNLFLSHNLVALLALASPLLLPLLAACRGSSSSSSTPATASTAPWKATLAAQLLTYFLFFSLKTHKEERFMYPIYPLLPLLAALVLDAALDALAQAVRYLTGSSSSSAQAGALGKPQKQQQKQQQQQAPPPAALRPLSYALVGLFFAAVAALSLSRAAMTTLAFTGHSRVWAHFARATTFRLHAEGPHGDSPPLNALAFPIRSFFVPQPPPPPSLTVCAGGEWHRFPSSFFLPEKTGALGGGGAALRFIRFEPNPAQGHPCLPHPFNTSAWGGQAPNPLFNSDNREVPEFFVGEEPLSHCDYLVDFQGVVGQDAGNPRQPWFRGEGSAAVLAAGGCVAGWRAVYSTPFLDRAANPGLLAKTFYVPGVSDRLQQWGRYYLLAKC